MLNPTHRSPNGLLHLIALTIGTSLCGAENFEHSIRPLLNEYCGKCHSTKEQKGDLDLERFATFADVKRDPRVWQLVEEQMVIGEMPPMKSFGAAQPRLLFSGAFFAIIGFGASASRMSSRLYCISFILFIGPGYYTARFVAILLPPAERFRF